MDKLQKGKTYKVSGWVRLDNANQDNITLSVESEDDNPVKYTNIETLTCSNTDWTELSGKFTFNPSGTVKTFDIYFEGPETNINFFVDDVTVTEESSAAASAEPNKPAKVEPKAEPKKAEADASKADPNAPKKADPNAPKKAEPKDPNAPAKAENTKPAAK
jgi:hypothetical protein